MACELPFYLVNCVCEYALDCGAGSDLIALGEGKTSVKSCFGPKSAYFICRCPDVASDSVQSRLCRGKADR